MFGAEGDDIVSAGRGNDSVEGGAGNDVISGGNGRDTIEGAGGDDQLHGGAGRDQFIFDGEFGQDQISGFNTLQDELLFLNLTADDVLIEQDGADLILSAEGFEAQGAVRLVNTSGLEIDDLMFA